MTFCLGLTAAGTQAPCSARWLPFDVASAQGVDGAVGSTIGLVIEWDPDGAGPREPVLAASAISGYVGAISSAERTPIMLYDRQTGQWSPFPSQSLSGVGRWEVNAQGELVVGGSFQVGNATYRSIGIWRNGDWELQEPLEQVNIGSVVWGWSNNSFTLRTVRDFTVSNSPPVQVQRRTAAGWQNLGAPLGGSTSGVIATRNNSVVAWGFWGDAGGVPALQIARWNGLAWEPFGAGFSPSSGSVLAAVEMPNGDIIAGGSFNMSGTTTIRRIARWRVGATAWEQLGPGVLGGEVNSLTVLPDGRLAVGGTFNTAGGIAARGLAIWQPPPDGLPADQGVWQSAGITAAGAVRVTSLRDGRLVGIDRVSTLFNTTERLVFGDPRGTSWDWTIKGAGGAGVVRSVTQLADGSIVVAGTFNQAGGVAVTEIARWTPDAVQFPGAVVPRGTWSPMGSVGGRIDSIAALANGDVIAGWSRGISSTTAFSRWTGTEWVAYAPDLSGVLSGLAIDSDGRIIASGSFAGAVTRWNGTSWSPLGAGLTTSLSAGVLEMFPGADGFLYVRGYITGSGATSTGSLAKWNGQAWLPVGPGLTPDTAPTGLFGADALGRTLFAGGVPAGIRRWDDTQWVSLTSPSGGAAPPSGVTSFAGLFADDFLLSTSSSVVRWNGTTWVGASPSWFVSSDTRLARLRSGISSLPSGSAQVLAYGGFQTIGTTPSSIANSLGRYIELPFTAAPAQLTLRPTDTTVCAGQTAELVATASGDLLTYRWQMETFVGSGIFANIADGIGLQGRVEGTTTPVLRIAGVGKAFDGRRFRVIVNGTCSADLSPAARLTVKYSPDVAGPNQSTSPDGVLTADDIIVFLGWFFASDARADIAGPNQTSGPDTQFTADDVTVFLSRFFEGC